MPHTRSAEKRHRQSERHRARNKAHMSTLRTQVKKLREALAAGDLEHARAEHAATVRALDKAVSKGIIHRNQAGRRKSRYARQLAQLQPASPE